MDNTEYLRLITSEHNSMPNYMSWLSKLLQAPLDELNLMSNIYSYFDLDSATGQQQDIIGELIGVQRIMVLDGVTVSLNDDEYRLIQMAKIAQSRWDGTIENLYEIWDEIFPNVVLVITDNQDMGFYAKVIGSINANMKLLIQNGYIVPKPAGVRVQYTFATTTAFGYGMYNDLVKGYDEGEWVL